MYVYIYIYIYILCSKNFVTENIAKSALYNTDAHFDKNERITY